MEKKKLFIIGLVILTMTLATFAPVSKIVSAGTTDNLQITFRFKGNKTIDVNRSSYNFTNIWAPGMKNTTNTFFQIFNNGSSSIVADVWIVNGPSGLTCQMKQPTGTDTFALLGLKGTIQFTPWYNTSSYTRLDNMINKSQPRSFGLRIYAANVSALNNNTWKMMNITYRAT